MIRLVEDGDFLVSSKTGKRVSISEAGKPLTIRIAPNHDLLSPSVWDTYAEAIRVNCRNSAGAYCIGEIEKDRSAPIQFYRVKRR